MTGPDLRLRERVPVAQQAFDPPFGKALAQRWVTEHVPGGRLLRARTHTALYSAGGALSVRISAELDGGPSAEPGVTLLVRSQAGDISTTAFPDDPALPTLPTLLDPAAAAEVIAGAVPELAATGAPEARWRVTVVHHPRTGACVLRYDAAGGPGATPALDQLYAKVYPTAAEARAAAAALTALGSPRLSPASGLPVRLPRLLGGDEDSRAVFLESLGAVEATADQVGPVEAAQALRALHDRTPVAGLPRVRAADEVDQVRSELALARSVWPDLADLLTPHVHRVADLLARPPVGCTVLTHGDFTPSQLVRLPSAIGLLDLDTLRWGEAASDLGRYLAYHDLRVAGSTQPASPGELPGDPLAGAVPLSAFLTAYGGGTAVDPDLPDRVLAYRRLNLTRVALRAARRFKERRVHLALALLDHPRSPEGARDDHDGV